MIKQLAAMGTVAAVGALTVGSALPATGHGSGGGDDDHGMTIRVVSINTEENFVDTGKQGPSLGDEFVFTSRLLRYGHRVGHTGVVCTVTSVATGESQCLGTAYLRRGQITVQGLVPENGRSFPLAVTGGTGAFTDAGGTLIVKELSGNRELLTFRLVS